MTRGSNLVFMLRCWCLDTASFRGGFRPSGTGRQIDRQMISTFRFQRFGLLSVFLSLFLQGQFGRVPGKS
jgi:hypothetical protein